MQSVTPQGSARTNNSAAYSMGSSMTSALSDTDLFGTLSLEGYSSVIDGSSSAQARLGNSEGVPVLYDAKFGLQRGPPDDVAQRPDQRKDAAADPQESGETYRANTPDAVEPQGVTSAVELLGDVQSAARKFAIEEAQGKLTERSSQQAKLGAHAVALCKNRVAEIPMGQIGC